MHIVPRVLYWVSLATLALALVAPMLSARASWSEAEVGVLVALALTSLFGLASIAATPEGPGRDAAEQNERRRRSAMIASAAAVVVMGAIGSVAYVTAVSRTETEVSRDLPAYEQDYRHAEIRDAMNGTWSGAISLGAAGAWTIVFLVFAATRTPQRERPSMRAPIAHATPDSVPPPWHPGASYPSGAPHPSWQGAWQGPAGS